MRCWDSVILDPLWPDFERCLASGFRRWTLPASRPGPKICNWRIPSRLLFSSFFLSSLLRFLILALRVVYRAVHRGWHASERTPYFNFRFHPSSNSYLEHSLRARRPCNLQFIHCDSAQRTTDASVSLRTSSLFDKYNIPYLAYLTAPALP